jgi:HAD superfamily phosphatase (TIGR01668 family)
MIHWFLKAKKFIPSDYKHSFFDIDFDDLYKKGYRYIISDLDNTLISYDEKLPTETIKNKFKAIKDLGFEIVLLSNNHQPRIDLFANKLGVRGFAKAKKPLKKGFEIAVQSMDGATKEKTIVIGDQLITDIYGANRYKVSSILVDPLKKKTEKWYTKANRVLEKRMLKKIKKNYREEYNKLGLEGR